MRILWMVLCLLLAGCGGSYTTRTEETGYKGKAKLDSYLAAARFLERMDYEVINKPGWPDLDNVSVMLVPASVLASDAFFPFRDNVDAAAQAGVAAIVSPGGSVRDAEVIAAADEHGIAMIFTGVRHFRH